MAEFLCRRSLRQGVLSGSVSVHAQLPGDGPEGKPLLPGLLYRLPASLLGLRGRTAQLVANWLCLSTSAPGGYVFVVGLVLIGRF